MKLSLLGGIIKIEVGDNEQAILNSDLDREDPTPAIISARAYNAGLDTIEAMLLGFAAHGVINDGNTEIVNDVIQEVLDALENNFEDLDDFDDLDDIDDLIDDLDVEIDPSKSKSED